MYLRHALRSLRAKTRVGNHGFNTIEKLIPNSISNSLLCPEASGRNVIKVLGFRGTYCVDSRGYHDARYRVYPDRRSTDEESPDPFSLVADELSAVANRLRAMVVAEVPKLASAAEYFFKMGVEGKRFRPTVLLLMASALNMPLAQSASDGVFLGLSKELRARQQSIAEITEMIHVASLLHDDVLDDAETRRGVGSLNFVMGNKISVLAGDFLLSRACVALASLQNTEVVTLLATVVEHLVTGETMQMTTTSEQRCRCAIRYCGFPCKIAYKLFLDCHIINALQCHKSWLHDVLVSRILNIFLLGNLINHQYLEFIVGGTGLC